MRLSEECGSEASCVLMISAFSCDMGEKKPPYRCRCGGRVASCTPYLGGPHPASIRPRMPMRMRTMEDRLTPTEGVAQTAEPKDPSRMTTTTYHQRSRASNAFALRHARRSDGPL